MTSAATFFKMPMRGQENHKTKLRIDFEETREKEPDFHIQFASSFWVCQTNLKSLALGKERRWCGWVLCVVAVAVAVVVCAWEGGERERRLDFWGLFGRPRLEDRMWFSTLSETQLSGHIMFTNIPKYWFYSFSQRQCLFGNYFFEKKIIFLILSFETLRIDFLRSKKPSYNADTRTHTHPHHTHTETHTPTPHTHLHGFVTTSPLPAQVQAHFI